MRAPRLGTTVIALAAGALLAVAVSSTSFSTAAFNAQKANPGNSLGASTYFGFFSSGFYTGNGVDNRAITGVGFTPGVVIVKGNTAQTGSVRTSTMSGDAAKPIAGATGLTANVIQSLDSNGFTIGTNARVNTTATVYEWMAFRAQEGLLQVGSYTGNGTSQSIGGLGFSPEYAAVFSAGASSSVQRYSGMTTSFQFDGDLGNATRITSLGANGFSVGAQNTVNTNGTIYHWIAFNDAGGIVDVSGYTGNNADNRSITGVGFRPEYVMVRANDTATARLGSHRPATLPGDSTLRHGAVANVADAIQLLQSDGFELGIDTSVNANAIAYHYLAVRDTADSSGAGCPDSGSQLVAPTADSYVAQDTPTANFGSSTSLFAQSGIGSANRRSLVRFTLPTIPAGCSLTGASLRLFSTAAATGRTIDVYRAAPTPAWTETGVTWSTQPATAGTASGLASAAGVRTWDVTAQTLTMYAGTNNGFIIRDRTEGNAGGLSQTYQAREATPDTQDPELRVSWG